MRAVFDRRATPPDGMHRRPKMGSYSCPGPCRSVVFRPAAAQHYVRDRYWLLCFAAEGAAVGLGVQRLAAVPAEAGGWRRP